MRLTILKEFFIAQYRIISRHRWGTFGAMIILLFMLIGLFADLLAPHQVWDTLRDSNGKLAIMRPPSAEFLLGTTAIGRDILSQMIYATRTTVLIGLTSGLISILIGANIGLIAGYYGGRVDEVLMRFTDIFYGMPFLPFLIVLISLFGRSIWFVILAICCIVWRTSARDPCSDPIDQAAPVHNGGQSKGMQQSAYHLRAYHALHPASSAPLHGFQYSLVSAGRGRGQFPGV